MADTCRNCSQPIGPKFCGHCGQEVEARRGPLFALLRDLLDDWFSLDGRLLRTLIELMHPGRLTERYLAGQRVAHLRPFRLYLLASVLLFSSALSLRAPDASEVNLYVAGHLATEGPAIQGRPNLTLFQPNSAINQWIAKRQALNIEDLRRLPPQEVLDGLFAGLRRVLPTALVLFVPFLALGLKVLYLRKKILYVDHLIFALHFQSVFFLGLAVTWLLCRPLGLSINLSVLMYALATLLILFVYMPLALHRVYRQPRKWTLLKSILLILIYGELLKLIGGSATLLVTTTFD